MRQFDSDLAFQFFDNLISGGTAKWLAIRFEPGGLPANPAVVFDSSISRQNSRVRQMVRQRTANAPRVETGVDGNIILSSNLSGRTLLP